ncbi:MAG: transposase [Planctomycetes bacterium]|nr:transposase [Planctomycetota bacterium]
MAKRKGSSKRQQAQHQRKHKKSQHDKRERLQCPNPDRKKTTEARIPLTGAMQTAVSAMQAVMDRRIAFRLAIIIAGMLLADDRRTASAWFVAGGVQDDWDRFYDCLISVGRTSTKMSTAVLGLVVQKFAPGLGDRIVLAMDDSPTSRYGQHVEGAGVHHHPTPGPADGEWLYGHNWVALAWLATHPVWGVIALPLRSMLYVREVDVPKLAEKYDWEFRTKHELGVELLTWFVKTLRTLGVEAKVWLAVDGAYAARPFLLPTLDLGIVVVSRLRKDACLYDLPSKPDPHQRGRHRIYGKNKISLAKRAAHKKGWQTISYHCRGIEVTRQVKTFLATSELVSGQIRVVIVRFEDGGWAPYFCTDSSAEVRDILETVAARWAIEEHFHDVKEVWGAGQQQVRNVWSNMGCWNLNGWLDTLVELCLWDKDKSELTDRSDRPWDNPDRRPSHADRRRTIAREMLQKQFLTALPSTSDNHKFRTLFQDLIALAV